MHRDDKALARVIEFGASVLAATPLFAATFKALPDVQIPRRSVWFGAP